jgi:hypothetical protein
MLPAAALFINSARASHVFLVVIFAVSAWNGATFYVEVFGRKYVSPPLYLLMFSGMTDTFARFEKELEKLRKEMELASATGSLSGPSTNASPYTEPISPNEGDDSRTDIDVNNSPLVLPGTNENAADMEVPDLILEKAEKEHESRSGSGSDRLKVR